MASGAGVSALEIDPDDDGLTFKTGYEGTPISLEVAVMWWIYKLNEVDRMKIRGVVTDYIDKIALRIRENP